MSKDEVTGRDMADALWRGQVYGYTLASHRPPEVSFGRDKWPFVSDVDGSVWTEELYIAAKAARALTPGGFDGAMFVNELINLADPLSSAVAPVYAHFFKMLTESSGDWELASYRCMWSVNQPVESPYAKHSPLLRNAPLIGFHSIGKRWDEAYRVSLIQCVTTDYAPTSVVPCALYTYLLSMLAENKYPFANEGDEWLRHWHSEWTNWMVGCPDPIVVRWRQRMQRDPELLTRALAEVTQADWLFREYSPVGKRPATALECLRAAVWSMDACSLQDAQPQGVPVFSTSPDWPLTSETVYYGMNGSPAEMACLCGGKISTTAALAGALDTAMHGLKHQVADENANEAFVRELVV